MTIEQAEKILTSSLLPMYDAREAATITDWVMEHLTGLQKIDRIIRKQDEIDRDHELVWRKYQAALLRHRPVQYVLGEAWFMGMRFFVNEDVLIPRPETEELVSWLLEEAGEQEQPLTILDVGTGSGCIPVMLKKKMPLAHIHSCDISDAAIRIAKRNAEANGQDISFYEGDFLQSSFQQMLPDIDILVSNPPYIPVRDRSSLAPHVVNYEPHAALFVPDHDPLIFYRAMAGFARKKLLHGGKIFAELHSEAAKKAEELFRSQGFSTTIREDMQGKARMIKATMLP